MYDLSEYPFGITDVARILNLHIRRKYTSSWDTDCPFCGNSKGKMNINIQKNVFRCNRCGESGGMLDLYGKLYNVTHREAYEEICSALHLGTIADRYQVLQKPKEKPDIRNAELASPEELDRTYSLMLSYLTLSEKHFEDLRGRGLTDEQIRTQRYRTIPLFGYKNLVKKLLAEGCVVKGVPGFYLDKDDKWTINFSSRNSGFLIPVISIQGRIQGFQIRLDQPTDSRKYIWLSSVNYNQGVSSGSPVHIIGDISGQTLQVTEGPLKGTISHYLSGESFACVAGVNQYRNLKPVLEELKRLGVRRICEAYDMDKKLKPYCRQDYGDKCSKCEHNLGNMQCNVDNSTDNACTEQIICPGKLEKRTMIQNGCQKLYEICQELELPFKRMVWDMDKEGEWNGDIKGIDDYYYDLHNHT